jgi:hydroxylamine dehydrogenase
MPVRKFLSCFAIVLFAIAISLPASAQARKGAALSAQTKACIGCHRQAVAPLIYDQWSNSGHASAGIGCYECHQADKSRPEAFEHNGYTIAVLVGPTQCGRCHAREVKEFEGSHHAKAGEILGSLDNVLGDFVEGEQASVMGCQKCHGSKVKVAADGKFDPKTWPNEGIGRLNPDGSLGSCSVCHSRHTFSVAVARQPESCGYCHLGPDHPQIEIYNESKHGVTYRAFIDKMNLGSRTWMLGKDYIAAPTCTTCHTGATSTLPNTHDVGTRTSWNLRPEVAFLTPGWQQKRAAMKQVCTNCHASDWVDNFYLQYDAVVNMSNEKFFIPAREVMLKLAAAGKVSKVPFDSRIKWTYFELWHHQGRRSRMGASMMGNDYVQWHGFYEVAQIFYGEFLPEAEALLPGVTEQVKSSPANAWEKGLTPENREKMEKFYEEMWHAMPQMAGQPPAPPMTGPPAAPAEPAHVMTEPNKQQSSPPQPHQ